MIFLGQYTMISYPLSLFNLNHSWHSSLDNESFWQDLLFRQARQDRNLRHFLTRILEEDNPLQQTAQSGADEEKVRYPIASLKTSLRHYLVQIDLGQCHQDVPLSSMRQIFFKVAEESEKFTRFWSNLQTRQRASSSLETICLDSQPQESSIKSVLHFAARQRIVVGYVNGDVRCYDQSTLAVKEHFRASTESSTPIFCLAAFRHLLVTGAGSGSVTFWNFAEDGSPKPVIHFRHDVGPVCFLKIRDDRLIASSYSGLITVWRLELGLTSACVAVHPILNCNVGYWEMDVDVDRDYVASAASDGLRLWKLSEDDQEPQARHIVDEQFYDLAVYLVPRRDYLVVATDGGILKLLKKSTGKLLARFYDGYLVSDQPSTVVKLSRVEHFLVATYAEGWVRAWDLERIIEQCCQSSSSAAAGAGDNGDARDVKTIQIPSESMFPLEAAAVDYTNDSIAYSKCTITEQNVYLIREKLNL